MEQGPSMVARVGTFFLLVGTFFTILFVASDMGETTNFGYFFLGLLGLVLGWGLKRRAAQSLPKTSNRFAGIRKLIQKWREAKAKREEAKKAKQQAKKK
jgi:cytochrome b